jgi:hypothetical protein
MPLRVGKALSYAAQNAKNRLGLDAGSVRPDGVVAYVK